MNKGRPQHQEHYCPTCQKDFKNAGSLSSHTYKARNNIIKCIPPQDHVNTATLAELIDKQNEEENKKSKIGLVQVNFEQQNTYQALSESNQPFSFQRPQFSNNTFDEATKLLLDEKDKTIAKLEKELQEQKEELKEARRMYHDLTLNFQKYLDGQFNNEEEDQISERISHDLQAPINEIKDLINTQNALTSGIKQINVVQKDQIEGPQLVLEDLLVDHSPNIDHPKTKSSLLKPQKGPYKRKANLQLAAYQAADLSSDGFPITESQEQRKKEWRKQMNKMHDKNNAKINAISKKAREIVGDISESELELLPIAQQEQYKNKIRQTSNQLINALPKSQASSKRQDQSQFQCKNILSQGTTNQYWSQRIKQLDNMSSQHFSQSSSQRFLNKKPKKKTKSELDEEEEAQARWAEQFRKFKQGELPSDNTVMDYTSESRVSENTYRDGWVVNKKLQEQRDREPELEKQRQKQRGLRLVPTNNKKCLENGHFWVLNGMNDRSGKQRHKCNQCGKTTVKKV